MSNHDIPLPTLVVDLRVGMVLQGPNGEPFRVESRELRPTSSSVRSMVAIVLRNLVTNGVLRGIHAANCLVEELI